MCDERTIEERALESAETRKVNMEYRLAASRGNEKTKKKWARSTEVAEFIEKAVKKQIALEPKEITPYGLVCPICFEQLGQKGDYLGDYCSACGQKILEVKYDE